MFDVVAIGNALVDTEYELSEEILTATGLSRGTMTLADTPAQNALFTTLSTQGIKPTKRCGGGSAANSMVAFASLGGRAFYHCRVGADETGQFYLADLAKSGVTTNAVHAVTTGETGTCAVLVTPDAERTMQTHLGASADIHGDNVDFDVMAGAKYLYLEGYLAMSPQIMPAIAQLCTLAKQNGTKIVVSFADPAVVNFAKDGLLTWLGFGVDKIFCNLDEAKLFAQTDDSEQAVTTLLNHAKTVIVTCGKEPTLIGTHNPTPSITAVPVPQAVQVVDTNGAGDNFAGAFLYGLTQGMSLPDCVTLAGTVASQVVAQFGARLDKQGYQSAKNSVIG